MRAVFFTLIAGLLPLQAAQAVDIHDLFDTLDPNFWDTANGWSNGSYTDTYWRSDHANVVDGKLILTLDDQPCAKNPKECANKPIASAEVKTLEHFNYGEVEASMKAAKGPGLITGLFKYTGAFEGNPQDEIDFEILGKDPTKVQLNYFVNGQGGHEKIIDLGFDASEDFHVYRYVHTQNSIEWYVDGELIHSVSDVPLPSHAGKIYLDVWAAALGSGTANYWAGNYTPDDIPATAEFEYINIISYPDVPPTPPPTLEEQTPLVKYDGFETLDDSWTLANGWSNGSFSATGWRSDHANIEDGILTLRLDDEPCTTSLTECSEKATASAEISSRDTYGFGTVEVKMQAAKGEGLITALFKFTGPLDGTPQDEVDIEILGSDPTKAQFNYFVAGEGGHEKIVDLGFDASEGFHTYAFRHTPTSLEWLVDGVVLHSVSDVPVPTYPGKIMMNLWAAQPGSSTADYWAGNYDSEQLPATVQYEYVHIIQGVPKISDSFPVIANHSNMVIGSAGPDSTTGTPLSQQANSGLDSQRWYTEEDEGLYRVKSWATHKCLSLEEATASRIEEQACRDSNNQRWAIVNIGSHFNLVSAYNGNCLDVAEASLIDGAAIVPSVCNGSDSQNFTLEGFAGGNTEAPEIVDSVYAIKNDSSGKYLDVKDGGTDIAKVITSDWYSGLSQTWSLENVSNNLYKLRPEHSDKCLSLSYAGSTSGIGISQYSCSESPAMLWARTPVGKRTEWRNAFNNMCLTQNSNDGSMSASTCSETPNQRWAHVFRELIPDSIVPLINFDTGLYLEIPDQNLEAGTVAEQAAENSTSSQQWRMEHVSDGYYHLRPQHSDQCLSLSYKGLSSGINVVQYNCTDSNGMLWKLHQTNDTLQWVNAFNEHCLSINPNIPENPTIQAVTCDANTEQHWATAPFETPSPILTGTMINAASGLNMEVADSSTAVAANIQQALANGNTNQVWTAEPITGDEYKLHPGHSNQCLSLAYKGSSSGINAVQYSCTDSEAMRWKKVTTNSTTQWLNLFNGHCLAISPSDVLPGSNIEVLNCTDDSSQQWQMN